MEGLNNSNTTTTTTPASSIMSLSLPLDSFASVPVQQATNSDIQAVCFAEDTAKGLHCYVYSTCMYLKKTVNTHVLGWRAEDSGVPDIAINDCAMMLSSLCGSETREQSRHGAVASTKETALFVREIKAGVQQPGAGGSLREGGGEEEDGISLHKGVMLESKVDATLTITSTDSKMNTWLGFKSQGALFLRGNGWDDMDIRQSVVAALDLAEEQLGCHTVYLCLEKSNEDLAKLVRALMYAGFEVVHPGVLVQADPKYLILGMEL